MKITKREIALIHVAKAKIGLTDDEYRDLLQSTCGVESSKELTSSQFDDLMKRFRQMGFQLKIKQPPTAANPDPKALPTPAHLQKIKELFLQLGWNNERQLGFVKRQIKRPWPQTRHEANQVIEGLKAILERAKQSELQ
jgi:phage gp16-like protein